MFTARLQQQDSGPDIGIDGGDDRMRSVSDNASWASAWLCERPAKKTVQVVIASALTEVEVNMVAPESLFGRRASLPVGSEKYT